MREEIDHLETPLLIDVYPTNQQHFHSIIDNELRRLDPPKRLVLSRRMKEIAAYNMDSAKRRAESEQVKPALNRAKLITPLRMLSAIAILLALVLIVVAFCYWIIVGVPHPNPVSQPDPFSGSTLPWVWSLFLTWSLIRTLKREKISAARALARQVTLPVIGLSLLVIAVTVGVAFLLDWLFPWLDRSWLYALPGFQGEATNLSLIPLRIKYFGIAFLVLLAVRIPDLARSEEITYRRGTIGWKDGIPRSLRFGLAHCLVGVPLYVGLALTVGGLWFTFQYLRGGVEKSTLYHATYNWIVLAACFITAVIFTIK